MSTQYALRLFGRDVTPAFDRASWLWAILLASYFFLLGVPRLFTISAAVLLLVGIWQSVILIRAGGVRGLPAGYRNYIVLFLLFWGPLLLSLSDAKYFREAAADTFKILGYFFTGISCVWLAREKRVVHPLVILLVGLALFWTADVLFQRSVGFDIFGVAISSDVEARAGAYFKNQLKFGPYLACMAVLAMVYLAPRMSKASTVFALWMAFMIALLFTMTRTAWLIFMIFSVPILFVYVIRPVRYAGLWLSVLLFLAAGGLYAYYLNDPVFQSRMERTLAFMNGMTYENWNTALTYRLDLWRVAWQMFSEHWINGMGLHAFTNDFNSYPAAPFWTGIQPSHEHQYLLQVMAAGGLIGLAGIVAIHLWVFRMWRQSGADKAVVFPLLMYLMALWFPINSHFPIYSSEWVWANLMLLGLVAGALDAGDSRPDFIRA